MIISNLTGKTKSIQKLLPRPSFGSMVASKPIQTPQKHRPSFGSLLLNEY